MLKLFLAVFAVGAIAGFVKGRSDFSETRMGTAVAFGVIGVLILMGAIWVLSLFSGNYSGDIDDWSGRYR